MCGFAGEIAKDGAPDMAALRRMSATLAPRGPDGNGEWSAGAIGLVHRRLKIIDLSQRGDQPMVDAELGFVTVFNGCIYNHHELREELTRAGYHFRSHSDTEVIAKALHHWGPKDFVTHLIGMFAAAIVDPRTGDVILARDRLGIKPLYLAETSRGLRFASTLPALLAGGGVDTTIDPVALHHYLSFHSVVPSPRTILRGVRRVHPSTVLTLHVDGRRSEHGYWAPNQERDPARAEMTAEDWRDAVLASLRTAVARRMVADVPVGVLLSGGLDSSLIVALLADRSETLKTFSIGFERSGEHEGDEFVYSDRVAETFGTEHHQIHVSTPHLVPAIDEAIGAMSEPMVSHDAVAFFLLSRQVSEHVKVVQSGQGADEVFAGYSWYPPLRDVSVDDAADAYAAEFIDRPHAEATAAVMPGYRLGDDPSRAFVAESFSQPGADEALDRALRLDISVMLTDDPVKRVDNMTMAHGLEARTPFLDHELVELAGACPPSLKLADDGKGPLKAAGRQLLPLEVVDREKGYFPVPALKHLSGEVLTMVQDVMSPQRVRDRGLFDPRYVERLLADPNGNLTTLEGNKLWQAALLELWLSAHVDAEAAGGAFDGSPRSEIASPQAPETNAEISGVPRPVT